MEIVFYIFAYCIGYVVSIACVEFDEENSYGEYIALFIYWPLLFLIYIGIILYFCIKTLFNKWKKS